MVKLQQNSVRKNEKRTEKKSVLCELESHGYSCRIIDDFVTQVIVSASTFYLLGQRERVFGNKLPVTNEINLRPTHSLLHQAELRPRGGRNTPVSSCGSFAVFTASRPIRVTRKTGNYDPTGRSHQKQPGNNQETTRKRPGKDQKTTWKRAGNYQETTKT